MAKTRLTLHDELCEVLGSSNCYFSPPSKMKFPCIRYVRQAPDVGDADNMAYRRVELWVLTIIDHNPDSEIPKRLEEHFPQYCRKDREYVADGLYYYVYNLYY